MKLIKHTIKTEACLSDDNKHRIYLRKEWDKTKAKALVVMISSGSCDGLTTDFSTLFSVNNLVKLDYGSVEIMNLFTEIDTPVRASSLKKKTMTEANDEMLLKKAGVVDTIIFAYGRAGNTNKIVQQRIDQVTKLLEKHISKSYLLADSKGRIGFHPLAPSIRKNWDLQPIQ